VEVDVDVLVDVDVKEVVTIRAPQEPLVALLFRL